MKPKNHKSRNILLSCIAVMLSSCGVHSGLTRNFNNQTTEVSLSKKNYRIVSRVQGESSAVYIFGIGGVSKSAMIAEAKSKMLSNAELVGTSRAIINENVETHNSFFPFVKKYTVIVSAYVIEFLE